MKVQHVSVCPDDTQQLIIFNWLHLFGLLTLLHVSLHLHPLLSQQTL